MSEQAFPSVSELLMHEPPMLLLDAVLSFSPERLEALVIVGNHELFVDDGRVPCWIGIEFMAQAVGAHVAMLGRLERGDTRPVQGLILGTRHFEPRVAAFAADECVIAHTEVVFNLGIDTGVYDCSLYRAVGDRQASRPRRGDLLASSRMTLLRTPDVKGFLESVGQL